MSMYWHRSSRFSPVSSVWAPMHASESSRSASVPAVTSGAGSAWWKTSRASHGSFDPPLVRPSARAAMAAWAAEHDVWQHVGEVVDRARRREAAVHTVGREREPQALDGDLDRLRRVVPQRLVAGADLLADRDAVGAGRHRRELVVAERELVGHVRRP